MSEDKRLTPGQAYEALKILGVKEEDRRCVTATTYCLDGEHGRPHWLRLDLHRASASDLIKKISRELADSNHYRIYVDLGWNNFTACDKDAAFINHSPQPEKKVEAASDDPELPEEIGYAANEIALAVTEALTPEALEARLELFARLILKHARK